MVNLSGGSRTWIFQLMFQCMLSHWLGKDILYYKNWAQAFCYSGLMHKSARSHKNLLVNKTRTCESGFCLYWFGFFPEGTVQLWPVNSVNIIKIFPFFFSGIIHSYRKFSLCLAFSYRQFYHPKSSFCLILACLILSERGILTDHIEKKQIFKYIVLNCLVSLLLVQHKIASKAKKTQKFGFSWRWAKSSALFGFFCFYVMW